MGSRMTSGFPELAAGMPEKRILDIGCGRKKLPGAIGLDQLPLPGVDIVADLNEALPFDDETFDAVHADQVLEHVPDLVMVVYEAHRILKPGGMLVAHTPYFRSSWAHIDPTHARSFTINSMDYFVRGTFCHDNYRFRDEAFDRIEIFLDKDYSNSPLRRLMRRLAIRAPFRFENSMLSSLYPFEQISYVLTK
jgi:SAM-dependent methyltransferase